LSSSGDVLIGGNGGDIGHALVSEMLWILRRMIFDDGVMRKN